MRANRLFWPLMLIIFGGFFLLDNMRLIRLNVWSLLFPVLLILAGLLTLINSVGYSRRGSLTMLSIPLEGAESARLRIKYGAGKVAISGGAASGDALSGTFEGGVDHEARKSGGGLDVTLNSAFEGSGGPWFWDGGRREWDVRLNGNIGIALDLDIGAAETRVDLTDVRVTDLKLQTGASSTDLWMPAHAGQTKAKISGGAASVKITIPAEVAARIQWDGGFSSIHVDTRRFPQSDKVYQSPNYDTAANKVDLKVDMGIGSVDIA